MNTQEPWNRRHFLAVVLTGIGLLVLRPLPLAGGSAAPAATRRAAARLAGLFVRGPSAHGIGRAYLDQAPRERNAPTLVRLIADSLSLDPAAIARMDDATVRHVLARRIRQDFAHGHTASVDGWVLSRTEARLYAVAALVRAA